MPYCHPSLTSRRRASLVLVHERTPHAQIVPNPEDRAQPMSTRRAPSAALPKLVYKWGEPRKVAETLTPRQAQRALSTQHNAKCYPRPPPSRQLNVNKYNLHQQAQRPQQFRINSGGGGNRPFTPQSHSQAQQQPEFQTHECGYAQQDCAGAGGGDGTAAEARAAPPPPQHVADSIFAAPVLSEEELSAITSSLQPGELRRNYGALTVRVEWKASRHFSAKAGGSSDVAAAAMSELRGRLRSAFPGCHCEENEHPPTELLKRQAALNQNPAVSQNTKRQLLRHGLLSGYTDVHNPLVVKRMAYPRDRSFEVTVCIDEKRDFDSMNLADVRARAAELERVKASSSGGGGGAGGGEEEEEEEAAAAAAPPPVYTDDELVEAARSMQNSIRSALERDEAEEEVCVVAGPHTLFSRLVTAKEIAAGKRGVDRRAALLAAANAAIACNTAHAPFSALPSPSSSTSALHTPHSQPGGPISATSQMSSSSFTYQMSSTSTAGGLGESTTQWPPPPPSHALPDVEHIIQNIILNFGFESQEDVRAAHKVARLEEHERLLSIVSERRAHEAMLAVHRASGGPDGGSSESAVAVQTKTQVLLPAPIASDKVGAAKKAQEAAETVFYVEVMQNAMRAKAEEHAALAGFLLVTDADGETITKKTDCPANLNKNLTFQQHPSRAAGAAGQGAGGGGGAPNRNDAKLDAKGLIPLKPHVQAIVDAIHKAVDRADVYALELALAEANSIKGIERIPEAVRAISFGLKSKPHLRKMHDQIAEVEQYEADRQLRIAEEGKQQAHHDTFNESQQK